jgi:hypothetical protein
MDMKKHMLFYFFIYILVNGEKKRGTEVIK